MADNLSPLVNLDLINKIYKTINAQITERVYNPEYYSEATLGSEANKYKSAWISGNTSTGTLNDLTLAKAAEGAGFVISGGDPLKKLTIADTATITGSLTVAAATRIKSSLTVSAATNVIKGLTVGTTDTGAVTIQSGGTSNTTIVGPSGGTANLINGTYTSIVRENFNTANTASTLVKRDQNGDILVSKVNGVTLGNSTASFTVAGGSATPKTLTVNSAATLGSSTTSEDGSVTVKSAGTNSTTIIGPDGGTAKLIKGDYKDSATTENNTTPEENKLLKIKKVDAKTFLAGPVTGTGKAVPDYRTIAASDLPEAKADASGIVTTEAQTFEGAKTFNKTIIGDINGNAGTATKLETARSFKIADADSTNISAAGVDFDGTEPVTLKLPATIKAALTGNADTASQVKTVKASTSTNYYISFVDSDNATATAETVYTSSKLTYNPFTGTLSATSFNGTADKTAHSLSITDGASTSAINSWNGSTDAVLTIKGDSPITVAATDDTITITHDNSEVIAGTYRSLTVDAKGHVTAGTNPTTLSDYGITDAKIEDGIITLGSNTIIPLTAESTLAASKVSGTLATSNIPNLDASKITSGTIDVERLPATALERCVVVADDAARFALTTSSVQIGDTVKVANTKKMYMVVDSSKLSSEAGYEEYFTSTDWSTIIDKPDSFTPASHPHGNITNSGAIGNTPDKLIATSANGVLTAATTLAATSLATGSTPTVSLSNGTLTFGIPKGDKGDTGPAGPNFDLSVGSGNQYLIGASSATSNIKTATTSTAYFNGSNLYASGFYVSSLRSLKENIEPTKVNATDLINSQEIVDFNYKADEDKTHKVGLIADDSDPLFLDKRGETVDLYNTCGILMKAVQELSKKIEELEQKLS